MLINLYHEEAVMPIKKSAGAAGYDLFTIDEGWLAPGQRRVFRTGIKLAILPGWVGYIRPRSGLARGDGIDVLGGVIDSDYRGDVGVILINHGQEALEVCIGDRIAQIVFHECWQSGLRQVGELPDTLRGDNGYGSTGMKG